MARARITMRQLRKILEYSLESRLSLREVATLTGASKTTISEYLARFRNSGITYQDSLTMSDQQLVELFEEKKEAESEAYKALVALFPAYEVKLKKKGMTRQLLWQEYRRAHPEGYLYSQFCHHLRTWRDSLDVTMHQHHEPGDKAFLDYTGRYCQFLWMRKSRIPSVRLHFLPRAHHPRTSFARSPV